MDKQAGRLLNRLRGRLGRATPPAPFLRPQTAPQPLAKPAQPLPAPAAKPKAPTVLPSLTTAAQPFRVPAPIYHPPQPTPEQQAVNPIFAKMDDVEAAPGGAYHPAHSSTYNPATLEGSRDQHWEDNQKRLREQELLDTIMGKQRRKEAAVDKPVTELLKKLGIGRWGRGNGPIRQLISNIRSRRAAPAPTYRQPMPQRAPAPVAAAPKPAAPKAAPAAAPKAAPKAPAAQAKPAAPRQRSSEPDPNSVMPGPVTANGARRTSGTAAAKAETALGAPSVLSKNPGVSTRTAAGPGPSSAGPAKPAGSFLQSLAQGAGGAASGLLAGTQRAQQALPLKHSLEGMGIPRDFNFGGGESRQQQSRPGMTDREVMLAGEADRVSSAQAKYRVGNTDAGGQSQPNRAIRGDGRIQSGPFAGRDPVAEARTSQGKSSLPGAPNYSPNAGPGVAGGYSGAMEDARTGTWRPERGIQTQEAMLDELYGADRQRAGFSGGAATKASPESYAKDPQQVPSAPDPRFDLPKAQRPKFVGPHDRIPASPSQYSADAERILGNAVPKFDSSSFDPTLGQAPAWWDIPANMAGWLGGSGDASEAAPAQAPSITQRAPSPAPPRYPSVPTGGA